MENILIIGANGLVGHKTVFALHSHGFNVFATARTNEHYFDSISCKFSELDFSKMSTVKQYIRDNSIDIVVNCAAYTAVDKAEEEKDKCQLINALTVEKLARYCYLKEIFLVHISTDYVFDGSDGPYTESSIPNPLSVYGSSKLGGDNSILATCRKFAILRAIVVYGAHRDSKKNNFATWLISELKQEKNVRIVDDQTGTFTFAEDLVDSIVSVIKSTKYGIFNISGNELMNRYEMSCKIADTLSLKKSLISPIKTSEFNQPAERPLKSGFIIEKAQKELKFNPTSLVNSILKIDKQMQSL